jgi:hypothetical protein
MLAKPPVLIRLTQSRGQEFGVGRRLARAPLLAIAVLLCVAACTTRGEIGEGEQSGGFYAGVSAGPARR